ncbi:hypothetical protein [Mycobacterium adipatum]|jgi:hypothetical protein|nr:hypothetical protein [Mycobacterium adipatum]MBI5737805.1 hypothetical protein [Mycolicibacterium neoaurum]
MTPRRAMLVLAAVLLVVAVFRPTLGGAPAVTRIAGALEPSIFLIVDRSAAMAPHLPAVRDDIDAVIDRYPDARFAMITFDARPALDWPLSADSWSLRPVVSAMSAYPAGAESTTNSGAASTVLRYQLISAVQQFPKAPNLVFYFGAGAPDSTVPQRAFQVPENAVAGGAVIGYGTGATPVLQPVAGQLGVPYRERTDLQSVDEAVPAAVESGQGSENAKTAVGFELYWGMAGVAALLILVELYRALRQLRRTRLDRIVVGR